MVVVARIVETHLRKVSTLVSVQLAVTLYHTIAACLYQSILVSCIIFFEMALKVGLAKATGDYSLT